MSTTEEIVPPSPSIMGASQSRKSAVLEAFAEFDQQNSLSATATPATTTRKIPHSLLSPATRRSSTIVVKSANNIIQEAQPAPRTKVKAFNTVIRTEDHLTIEHLKSLMNVFFQRGGTLRQDEFQSALTDILGTNERFRKQMALLFQKMDTRGVGEIDWDEFCTYMMQDLQDKEDLGNERELPLLVCPQLFTTPHRGSIRRILLIPNPTRFLTASDDGTICYWNLKMNCTKTVSLATKQVKNLRVTDIAYMTNAFRIVVATVNRDLCFYDSATGALCNRVVGLSDVATSMDYYIDPADSDHSWLVFGDMSGAVNILLFTSASTQLFNPPVSAWHDGLNIHFSTIEDTPPAISTGTVVRHFRFKTHVASDDEVDKSVKLVQILPSLNAVVSCAATAAQSLVLRSLDTHEMGAHFSVPKGIATFDYSERWNLVATGGADTTLRLWNPYVPTHPTAMLKGHAAAIAHVAFSPEYGQVFSVAVNEVIKIWDIKDQVCLNTLTSIIPHRPLYGRQPLSAMLWHDASQSILTACRDELSVVQMTRDESTRASQTSHEAPIVAVAFIPEFNRIVSADVSGTLTSWDVCTGQKLLQFRETHGSAQLTAMAPTHGGKRLMTGGSDGTIRVWNTLSGTLLQQLVKGNTMEVTALIGLKDRIICAGWDREVSCFKDSPIASLAGCPIQVNKDPDWQPNGAHTDDILTMDYCPDLLLATGAFDGRIIIWNLRSGRVISRFDSRTAQRGDSTATRPHHAVRAAVDKVLWLKHRARDSTHAKAANLVSSSDSGMIYFWHVFKGHLMGSFHAAFADQGSQTVTALTTDVRNKVLLTGDSLGYIRIWNIEDVCTGLPGSRDGKPRQLASWRGHVQSIASLQYLENLFVIISASTDCSVRVWTSTGQLVGTFSSSSAWVLPSDPSPLNLTNEIDSDESISLEGMLPPRMSTMSITSIAQNDQAGDIKFGTNSSSVGGGVGAGVGAGAGAGAGSNSDSLYSSGTGESLSLNEGESKTLDAILEDGPKRHMRVESVLSASLQRRLEQRIDAKVAWRISQSKLELARVTKPGFLFCQPYQALPYSEMDNIRTPQEPASAARARTQRLALWDEEDDKKAAVAVAGGGGGRVPNNARGGVVRKEKEKEPATAAVAATTTNASEGLFPPLTTKSRGPSRAS